MTVTSLDARDEYTATAAQTVFNYTFKIYASSELDVYITPVGQEADDSADITTAYTVDPATVGNSAGGFITLNSGANSGDLVTIVSGMPYNRTVDYQNSGDFLPDTVDGDNDRQVSQIKQVADLANRSVLFPQSLQNASSLSLPLPDAGLYLRWKSDLTGLENTGAPGVVVPSEVNGTASDMAADATLNIGDFVITTGYGTEGDGGDNYYEIVAAGYGTHDGGSFIDLAGSGHQAKGLFPGGLVNVRQFGVSDAVDSSTEVQAAIDYCLTNELSLDVNALCLLGTPINIDRQVDGAAYDNYFTLWTSNGGGFQVSTAISMFTSSLTPADGFSPVSQLIKWEGLILESTNNALAAYVIDPLFLRSVFDGCSFRKIKFLTSPTRFTQSIYFFGCQARRWDGVFFSSKNANFDLKVHGILMEAGGDAFDIDFPVGSSFKGATIEGMENYAITYNGAVAFSIDDCYFEGNGLVPATGCSVDGSAGTGVDGSETVRISSSYFSGDDVTTTKPQIKWGDCVTALSEGNTGTTTLHEFGTNSRVNIIADHARTALSTNDLNSPYSGIKNEMAIGHVYRAESQYLYGGLAYGVFVGGAGGHLRLRALDNGVESTTGLDIDNNGDMVTFGDFRQNPGSTVNPVEDSELVVEATSNTTLTFKLKGTDSVIRTGTITLS